MIETTKCPRCSECDGYSHHWLPNLRLGDHEAPEELQTVDFICKHCPALGNTCNCGGDGFAADGENEICPDCDGEGVVVHAV